MNDNLGTMQLNAPARWQPPPDTKTRRRIFYLRHLLICGLLLRRGVPLRTLGEEKTGCNWTFCPEALGPESVVYSGGVGNDITFEHGLVNAFRCTVHLLDPSPTGVATMNLPENKIPQFRFFRAALAGRNGTMWLAPPIHELEGSWYSSQPSQAAIEVPSIDLQSLMAKNSHSHLDLIKLDIEGAEYEVIDHIIDKRIPIRQILVEFHEGMLPGTSVMDSIRSMLKLLRNGYKLVARVGTNHTFLRSPRATSL